MALGTLTRVTAYTAGNKKVRVYDVQLSAGANYTTGGETITAAAVGLRKIEQAIPSGLATTTSGTTSRSVAFLYGNGMTTTKMLVQTTASAEAANNSDQSTFTIRVTFMGF